MFKHRRHSMRATALYNEGYLLRTLVIALDKLKNILIFITDWNVFENSRARLGYRLIIFSVISKHN